MKPLVFLPTSLCVPATMESAEDLKELFQIYELSLTVKSKPMQLPTLLRKWKRDNWMRVLCSRISSNFHFENYVEELPSCQQVFPANPSPVLGSDKQLKTPDTSGLGSQMELALCVQNTASLKMSQGSSVQPPQMENRYSSMSSETWNKEVINARGVYSQRKKLALHTKGNECLSLRNYPTPAARDYKGTNCPHNTEKKIREGKRAGMGQLPNFVMMDTWATPQASDHIEGARTAKESNQKCLGRDLNQMQNWPTPRTCGGSRPNGKGGKILDEEVKIEAGIRERGKILAEEAKKNWPTPLEDDSSNVNPNPKRRDGLVAKVVKHNGLQDQEKSNTSGKNHGSPKLNPSWVEQLMGLSTGWTDLGSWGMELSPKPQN